ncbi:hypothetical protein KUH03_30085 [Sphingobacterium sp. E70]|uniref:hypothetical protein n=1 Tax=Sphingobacterium sp. E70 TaxID=2853439 RepID=UPI00211CB23F|nr:hypothetical protein [Sphingobacterium sp. E70]ULT23409.1 hypothetical protein KUH03_30085 [Sphingobacterium sp. E70]
MGSAILHISSWKTVFLIPPTFGLIIFLWSMRLEESLPKTKRIPLSLSSLRKSVKIVLNNRTFLRYITITTLLFSALSAYVASSEHIIGEIYRAPTLFKWIFGGMGMFMALSTFTNSYLSSRY